MNCLLLVFRRLATVSALMLGLSGQALAGQACSSPGTDVERKALEQLAQRGFEVGDAVARTRLATGLLSCLGDPDPVLRDQIAFSAYATWMRGKLLPAADLRQLRDALYDMLDGEDAQGFRKPFAALTLAEVARTDRVEPWMSAVEHDAMVKRAAAYLESVSDYRGFDAREGWRHGVAHGSDWLMQLALNPALVRGQLDAILAAVAAQVMPDSGHAYVFGEAQRLAQPVLYVARRGLLTQAEWSRWFDALRVRLGNNQAGYQDAAWLARRHDLNAFLSELYVQTDLAEDAQIRALQTPVLPALRQLP